MFTVLFTSIGRRVELIKAFQESYRKHHITAKIIGVDSNPELAPTSFFTEGVFRVPRVYETGYADALLEICYREKVTLLIPLFEPEFVFLDERRQDFSHIGTFVMLSQKEILTTCEDKFNTFQFFMTQRIKTPQTWLADHLPGQLEFPLFVKPRKGMGSLGAHKVESQEQLEYSLRNETDLLVQQAVLGREYTLDILADFKGRVLSVVPRERLEVRSGEVIKSRTVARPDLIEQGFCIIEQLGAIGPVTLQCIDNGIDLYWIEINPRFGGGVPLTIAAGVDYPYIIYQLAHGETIKSVIGEYKSNLTMLRYDQSIFI